MKNIIKGLMTLSMVFVLLLTSYPSNKAEAKTKKET